MQAAYNQFNDNIRYIRDLDTLYRSLKHGQALPNDLSDLLRAEVVYAVSALDKLVHELVRMGMLEAFKGIKPKTRKFNGFAITAETLDKIKETAIEQTINPNPRALPNELPEYWFEKEILLKHRIVAYQDPDKISDGLSLIWEEEHKWQKIAAKTGIDEKTLKTTLKNIAVRRNQIVHEADTDIQTNTKNIIEEGDVKDIVDFIEKLGNALYNCVK